MFGQPLDRFLSQVFCYEQGELGHRFCLMVDVPSDHEVDTPAWSARRELARRWAMDLCALPNHVCSVFAYKSFRHHNAELNRMAYEVPVGAPIPSSVAELEALPCQPVSFESVYNLGEYWIALTEHCVLEPLKLAALRFGFRALNLYGFCENMASWLDVDVDQVDARVKQVAKRLTDAEEAHIEFGVDDRIYALDIDLRHRMGFASSGKLVKPGMSVVWPAGEACIAPYEGEKQGVISLTRGFLPLVNGDAVVIAEICENRVVRLEGEGPWADKLRAFIAADKACANLAELGLGFLGDWVTCATRNGLMDEKLGFHVALGRSENLGGVTSPSDFSAPENVCHVDFVYHRLVQSRVCVKLAELRHGAESWVLMKDGLYVWDDDA